MNIFSYHTPSHNDLFIEWFKPSIPRYMHLEYYYDQKQYCEKASFQSKGWSETQKNKISFWVSSFEKNINNVVICSDVDIQFLDWQKNLELKYLGERDIVFQQNRYYKQPICSGFFICRSNDKVIGLFNRVINNIDGEKHKGEQSVLNAFLIYNKTKEFEDLKWGFLPSQEVWCPGFEYSRTKSYVVPKNIRVHHANWDIGIDEKGKQLKDVRKKFLSKKI